MCNALNGPASDLDRELRKGARGYYARSSSLIWTSRVM